MSKETIVSEDQIEASPEVAADVEAVTESDQVADVAADSESEPAADEKADGSTRSKKETALENEGEIAADYLEELLDIADLDGDIDTYAEGGRAHISILTEGDVLVGKNGEVLEALQELARLSVMTETGHRSRLMLDIGGHREKRRKVLQDLAADAVAEVKDIGEPVRLAPMNPFERKIVHDAVAAAGLVSESEGEEPQRRVVVLPKD
ncbi:MAG TPA: R3H domain-containing nucleic acid-binding protein [Propionicimonas sp.]|nr:R3H domain-containing nucleic acid-binding protein [Propionicimonas sp.]HQA77982.1 R3H domain-containing nucleic acid-binding protein [Propionicimonas sp.]HQD95832.1 R3H domain-containing nucleic acid-binding protein [Propionicimonas sp.]